MKKITIITPTYNRAKTLPKVFESLLKQSFKDFLWIILDDGSHLNELTIKSFELLFPYLNSGGLYIIEDLGNSYNENIDADIKTGWPGMQYNKDVAFINKRTDLDLMFNKLIENIDLLRIESKIEWIHFYSRIVIIKKL